MLVTRTSMGPIKTRSRLASRHKRRTQPKIRCDPPLPFVLFHARSGECLGDCVRDIRYAPDLRFAKRDYPQSLVILDLGLDGRDFRPELTFVADHAMKAIVEGSVGREAMYRDRVSVQQSALGAGSKRTVCV